MLLLGIRLLFLRDGLLLYQAYVITEVPRHWLYLAGIIFDLLCHTQTLLHLVDL